ncbi:MAG: carbamoyl phosphate synthase small subunit [bacterium]|nr:carbamoyl phosphate synthase small subunit [bacterium]
MKSKVILETGDVFEGDFFIEGEISSGQIIFDTRVVGYEKVFTSPEYYGKIVCFTYPLIGNYGINYEDLESDTLFPSGIIISEHSKIYSNFRAKCSLREFLCNKKIPVVEGVDTQYITEIIRENKGIKGVIAPADVDEIEVQNILKEKKRFYLDIKNIEKVGGPYIAVVHPAKRSEIEILKSLPFGNNLLYVSFCSEIKEVLKCAEWIYLSSAFEDEETIFKTAEIIKGFIGKIPIIGSGAGHLALALAMGGEIAREKVNHYGTNHPVKDMEKNRKYITSQAHSFIVNKNSLINRIRFINITDGSVEGISDRKNKILSTTFTPALDIVKEFFSFV